MSYNKRTSPYTYKEISLREFFQENYGIPMAQRQYEWGKDQVDVFLADLAETKQSPFQHQMGDLMLLHKSGNIDDLYDGQQRILSLVMVLYSLSETKGIEEDLKQSILKLLTNNRYDDNISEDVQCKFNERYKNLSNVKIPRLHCVSPYDQDALVYILNGTDPSMDNKSKLIQTYNICKRFFEENVSLTDTADWWRYLSADITFTRYVYSDEEYAANRFEWLNNRGLELSHLDLVKNKIIVRLGDDKKVVFYNKWEELRHKDKYATKIYDVAIQIYCKKMYSVKSAKRMKDYATLHIECQHPREVWKNVLDFFNIIEKLQSFLDLMKSHRYGGFLFETSIAFEGFSQFLLPVSYTLEKVDDDLMHLFCKWAIRNYKTGSYTFNSMKYTSKFCEFSNRCLQGDLDRYYSDVSDLLASHVVTQAADCVKFMSTHKYKPNEVKVLLRYLETEVNTDIHRLPAWNKTTLEHISAQNKRVRGTDAIGNMTLLEGANSKNQKGNFSLGDKQYTEKRESYQGSTFNITRSLAASHEDFGEGDILKRSKDLAEAIENLTRYSTPLVE